MGTVSSFAEADKFACREWAIGYTSGLDFSDRGLPQSKVSGTIE
jgi:hypothetical protein